MPGYVPVLRSTVTSNGAADTGKAHGNPTNQAEKGIVLGAAVYRNLQLQLFRSQGRSEVAESAVGTQVWVLLYHVELGVHGVKEIRSELSLPSEFKGRKISAWAERIILRPLWPDDRSAIVAPLPAAPFDVTVERKTGT